VQTASVQSQADKRMQSAFMAWLNPNPALAEQELKKIRQMLLSKFGSRWYLSNEDVEDCIQETLQRVMQNVENRLATAGLRPEAYIHGVANNVLREKIDQGRKRSEREARLPENGQIADENENPEERILTEIERAQWLPCLHKCMAKTLSPEERKLLNSYYSRGSHYTKALVALFGGTSPNALRVRLHRIIHDKLKPCMEKCLK